MFNMKSGLKKIAAGIQETTSAIVYGIFKRIGNFFASASENKKELVRGSVLDPYNHPSYTPDERRAHLERAEQRAELQRQIEALS